MKLSVDVDDASSALKFPPPDLSDWLVFCAHCKEDHRVEPHAERDAKSRELYYEWTCKKCDTPLLTITRANPRERERAT